MSPHERGTHLFKKLYTAGRVEDFQPEAPSSNPVSSKSKLLKHQGRKQSQAFSLHTAQMSKSLHLHKGK